jgi:hypothetical protein
MILPTLRASFGRSDAGHIVTLLGGHDPDLRESARRRLDEEGLDSLLDDPRTLNALLTDPDASARPELVFYVLVRQTLLAAGVPERSTADYVASLLVGFGSGDRAYRVSADAPERYAYLVDLVARLKGADAREAFLLRTHLGNHSLWLAGLFPDFLEARTQRRGAPPMGYYEELGAAGYRAASESRHAESLGIDGVLRGVAQHFRSVRVALNHMSDRYMWPGAGNPVNRLLREVRFR